MKLRESRLRRLVRKVIAENINYDKWRRAYNKKPIARIVVYLKDPSGNKKRYIAFLMYRETQDSDVLYFSERLIGDWKGAGSSFTLSNLQNKPKNYFGGPQETTFYRDENEFNEFIDNLNKNVTKTVSEFFKDWFGETIQRGLGSWFRTGVYEIDNIKVFLNK